VWVLSAGSNSQNFRKGSMEIRELIAGGAFIRPARVFVAAVDSFLVPQPATWQN
jgi:hypothetical protein